MEARPPPQLALGLDGEDEARRIVFVFSSAPCVWRGDFAQTLTHCDPAAVNTTCAGMLSTQSRLRRARIDGEAKATAAEPQTRRREGPGAP